MTRNNLLIDEALTLSGAAVTLKTSMEGGMIARCFAKGRARRGQTAVEYILTTLALVVAFSGLYPLTQRALKGLFRNGAVKILTAYY